LVAALQNRLYSVENRAGLKFNLQSNLKERLPPAVEEGMYRIANEALNNTLKHAHAGNVWVKINQNPGISSMEIADDGIGFDPATACREGCLGVISMQERAKAQGWEFILESSPGRGARIRVEVKS
jgi:signal transduction histidine kinase